MANLHYIVLGLVAIINLANCNPLLNIPCQRKPFRKYAEDCYFEYGISVDLDVCTYESAGVLTEDGGVDAERFREIIFYPSFLQNTEHIANKYIRALHYCAKQVGLRGSPEATLRALDKCEEETGMEKLLKLALCPKD